MRSTKDFIKDGVMLTVTSLILRTAGVFFSARLSITAGNAVMGLYTQIMTVYAFAITASSAGINLGTMRIISECYGNGSHDRFASAMRTCVSYCLKAGLLVASILFFSASFLGNVILGDTRTVISLKALSLALPFIALSNALHGYFNGVKQISKSAFTSLFEQFVRIFATIIALDVFKDAKTEILCLVLVICNAASEALSCFLLTIFYFRSKKCFPKQIRNASYLNKRFIGITVPIAISSLIRSALTTTEHILIPIGLRSNGLDTDSALAEYGIVSGMVLPILLYPMALLTSFASITIAELSARVSAGESKDAIRKTVTKGLSFALIYGIGCSSIIGCFSTQLGYAIYRSAEAGAFIKIMAPLIFFMYLDHISDGMLKGLDKQNYVMKVNIIDAALSVLFAIVLIPRFGIYGFIASLYICECMNCFFSFGRIFMLISPDIKIFISIFIPAASALISAHFSSHLSSKGIHFVPLLITAVLLYIGLLKITGTLSVFNSNAPPKARTRCKA